MRGAGGIEIHIVPGEEARPSLWPRLKPLLSRKGLGARARGRARLGRRRRRRRRSALRASAASQPVDDLPHRGAVLRGALWDPRRGPRVAGVVRRLQFLLHRADLHVHGRAAAGTVRAAHLSRRRRAHGIADRAHPRPAGDGDQERRGYPVALRLFAQALRRLEAPTTCCGRPRRICTRPSAAASCFWSPKGTNCRFAPPGRPTRNSIPPRSAPRTGRSRRRSRRAGEPARCRASPISFGRCSPRAGRSRSAASSRIRRDQPINAEDERALTAILDLTAIALDRALLAREAVNAATMQENEKVRDALLDSLSHDLRTPLSSIAGAATSLRALGDKMSPAERLELLSSIEEETARLARFVANLLDMSRIEAGGLKVNRDLVVHRRRRAGRGRAQPQGVPGPSRCGSASRPICRSCAATTSCSSRCCSTCSTTRTNTRATPARSFTPARRATRSC